jgi:hypothetical protein
MVRHAADCLIGFPIDDSRARMDDYIRAWTEIIAHCNFDNTYKMAWAKSLLELSKKIA